MNASIFAGLISPKTCFRKITKYLGAKARGVKLEISPPDDIYCPPAFVNKLLKRFKEIDNLPEEVQTILPKVIVAYILKLNKLLPP